MEQINPAENLARYILQSNQIRLSDNTVKYNAFLPAPNGKTSVFRTTGLDVDGIWKIGDEVASQREKSLHGRADILAPHVIENGLDVDNDNTPPRHANIISWPEDKCKHKLLAMKLASNAQFYQR